MKFMSHVLRVIGAIFVGLAVGNVLVSTHHPEPLFTVIVGINILLFLTGVAFFILGHRWLYSIRSKERLISEYYMECPRSVSNINPRHPTPNRPPPPCGQSRQDYQGTGIFKPWSDGTIAKRRTRK